MRRSVSRAAASTGLARCAAPAAARCVTLVRMLHLTAYSHGPPDHLAYLAYLAYLRRQSAWSSYLLTYWLLAYLLRSHHHVRACDSAHPPNSACSNRSPGSGSGSGSGSGFVAVRGLEHI